MPGYKQHLLIQGGIPMADQTIIIAVITGVLAKPSIQNS